MTHSLIGVAIGRATGGHRAVAAAVIASNLPDLDFVAPLFLGGGNLSYVLHHRGWTHTLVFAPVIIAASLALVRTRARGAIVAASIAWLLHVACDWLNSYGVHPFSPFSDAWLYGDVIFVIEPLVWLALLPHVFEGASRRWKIAGAVIAAIGILATAFGPFGSLLAALVLAIWGAAMIAIRKNLAWVAAACLGILAVFAFTARSARRAIAETIPPEERILDLIVRPAPANPFCFDAVARTETDAVLISRLARLGTCDSPLGVERSATLGPATVSGSARVRWLGEWRTTRADLAALAARDCRFDALLRFARAPFFTEKVAGDLRFDFSPALDFAEVELGGNCPRAVPGWIPPAR